MNVRTNYPFNVADVRRFKYENAVFVVFLTGKLFLGTLIRFRHPQPSLLRLFPQHHLQRFVDLRQHRSPFAVGQKAEVAHHLKMPRGNVADIAPDHLFLAQRLAFMLPRAVNEVVVDHRATAIVPQAGGRHRRPLQVAAEVFHAVPGSPGLLREVYLPVPAILRLQITPPLALIADVTQTRQQAGHDLGVAVAQQADDRAPPDFLHSLLFKEEAAPNAVHNIQTTTGDGDVDGRMLIELAAIGVQGAEDADLDAQLARVPEQGAGGTAEQVVEQRPVVAEERPEQVWHGKGDVLPFAVGQDVLLLSNSLLGRLHAAGAAGL